MSILDGLLHKRPWPGVCQQIRTAANDYRLSRKSGKGKAVDPWSAGTGSVTGRTPCEPSPPQTLKYQTSIPLHLNNYWLIIPANLWERLSHFAILCCSTKPIGILQDFSGFCRIIELFWGLL